MGRDVPAIVVSRHDRRAYREKVRQCLDVFARMLRESRFEHEDPQLGLEIELDLVDDDALPSMRNTQVLDAIADPRWATELGQFNLEINVPPRKLTGDAFSRLEDSVRSSLAHADKRAHDTGARLVMIGILPTLRPSDVTASAMSNNPRYRLLDEQMFAARGEEMQIAIEGPERLLAHVDTIMPEAACTSVQFHLQVSPQAYASNWNAAQCIAGVQLALGANSPYFFGHQLWSETRIELFAQSTDTRPDELKTQGVRPRVWFGEGWITSIFDLFEENVRYFPSLLPEVSDEDPVAELAAGRTPQLAELRLHNGTVYRWNRPVYDVVAGRPHLRVENRVLPAGPTVIDMLANAAFYYGMLRTLADDDRPVWTKMRFAAAQHNFLEAARHGMQASLFWPGSDTVSIEELVIGKLLPMAHHGLDRWGVAAEVRDRLLGVIEGRARAGRNGAGWQVSTVRALQRTGLTRPAALAEMLRRYCDHMHSNEPVHTWEVPE